MAWKEITIATRYLKRQFEKGVGRSIAKVLTELITNADDSYRRIEEECRRTGDLEKEKEAKPIIIVIDRGKKTISVIDQAQGFDVKRMEECFVPYGGESSDRRQGITTRSLFGKGLRDVLFTQTRGIVKSIWDNKSCIAEFRWRSKDGQNRPGVDIKPGPRVAKDLREGWGIVRNGTSVEFRIREDIALPRHQVLAERLSNFYMLRLINSNPKRRVIVKSIYSGDRIEESPITYSPPIGELRLSQEITLEYESFPPIQGSIEIFRSAEDLVQDEHGYEERQGGLLITDEDDNVLDLTLFEYNRDVAARKLFGRVKLNGIGKIIREKLNAREPEEILTETRDGFNKDHSLHKLLSKRMSAILKPLVEKERAAGES